MSLKIFYICVLFFIASVSASIPYRPVTKSGVPCMVPFTYKGETYNDCNPMGSSRPWCYTSAAKDWDYCDKYLDPNKCNIANSMVNETEISSILEMINSFRKKIPAKRMAKLRWNAELAMRAQYMSNKCTTSNNDHKLCDSDKEMGQMSFNAVSTAPQPHKWLKFITSFIKKESEYSLENNSCGSDSCYGLKQLFSSKTTDIGCGVRSCDDSMYKDYYFCTFYPPYFSTEKPYEAGNKPCDSCYRLDSVNKYKCSDGLCEVCETADSNCQGADYLKEQIKSGSLCEDIEPEICKQLGKYCGSLDELKEVYKKLLTENCKKTCRLCQ